MAGGITALRSVGFLALIAGCSGRVAQPESDDGGEGGAARGGRVGAPGARNGGTSGAGGAPNGGAVGSSGVNSGGRAGLCKDESQMPASLSGARVDMPTVCSLGGPIMCKFTAAQHLEGYDCSADVGAIPWTPPYLIRKTHTVGCGNETVSWGGGKGGPSETFSLATGERVGASISSYSDFGPCNTSLYVAGQNPRDCPDTVETVCVARALTGDAGTDEECAESYLRHLMDLDARPECACSGDPGIAQCFSLGTCECWCSVFVRTARACAGVSW